MGEKKEIRFRNDHYQAGNRKKGVERAPVKKDREGFVKKNSWDKNSTCTQNVWRNGGEEVGGDLVDLYELRRKTIALQQLEPRKRCIIFLHSQRGGTRCAACQISKRGGENLRFGDEGGKKKRIWGGGRRGEQLDSLSPCEVLGEGEHLGVQAERKVAISLSQGGKNKFAPVAGKRPSGGTGGFRKNLGRGREQEKGK